MIRTPPFEPRSPCEKELRFPHMANPMEARFSLIVAMTKDRVIGSQGTLPWHITEDLRRFKKLTMGHALVMGRKTYESIGRPLPGRRSIVISRQAGYAPTGVETATSLAQALKMTNDDAQPFIIGGAQIYKLALPYTNCLYVTRVYADVTGDTFFPEVNWDEWELVEDSRSQTSQTSPYEFSFQKYVRG